MSWLDAIIYGVVQGVSEFLPISSSGHLALLPHYLNIPSPGLNFDFAMHSGTFLATLIYFRKMICDEIKILILDKKLTHLSRNILISTIISVLFILLLKPLAEQYRSVEIIAFNLILFGIFLSLCDLKKSTNKHITKTQAAFIGLSQALAVFPGVSRSGITISTSRFFSHSREQAAQYSFFISLPILFAGVIYKLPVFLSSTSYSANHLLIGTLTSFIIGILTIHFFLKLISRCPLYFFTIYRLLIASLILYSFII